MLVDSSRIAGIQWPSPVNSWLFMNKSKHFGVADAVFRQFGRMSCRICDVLVLPYMIWMLTEIADEYLKGLAGSTWAIAFPVRWRWPMHNLGIGSNIINQWL